MKIEPQKATSKNFNFEMKPLLVLDINGVLCRKVPKDYKGPTDLDLSGYKVILRPGCREFLEKCYQNFTVGFFSSTTYKNAGPILGSLLTPEQDKTTLFKWFRDRTSLDPNWTLGPDGRRVSSHHSWGSDISLPQIKLKDHSTVKRLTSVFESPFINRDRTFDWTNTIVCDDSIEKLRFNPRSNCFVVPSFVEHDNELDTLFERIEGQFSLIKDQTGHI